MKKIDVTKVHANGISGRNPWPQVSRITPIIETALSVFRLRYSTEEILEQISKGDPYEDLYAGTRFSNNDQVATRILSAVNEHTFTLTDNEEEAHQIIYDFFENISGKEMDTLIFDGLRCCASADHWYKYEKQWD
jgi:hypothetical protein